MRLFTPDFVLRWQGRMLNIHPSLLPAFPGLDPHGQALRAGVKISGATVHFVIPETDAGPIIAQAAVPVRDDDDVDTLAARVLAAEHRLYPLALALARGRTGQDRRRSLPDRGGRQTPPEALIVPEDMIHRRQNGLPFCRPAPCACCREPVVSPAAAFGSEFRLLTPNDARRPLEFSPAFGVIRIKAEVNPGETHDRDNVRLHAMRRPASRGPSSRRSRGSIPMPAISPGSSCA